MSEIPPLNKGDTVRVYGWAGEGVVTGFRSGGMLVDVVSHASGQTMCVPRRQAEGGYLTATKEEPDMSDDIAEAIGADIVIDTDAIDVGHLVAEHRAAIIEIERLRDEVRNLQIRLIAAKADALIFTGLLRDSEIRRRLLEPLHASTLDQSIRHSHQPFDDGGSDNERRD